MMQLVQKLRGGSLFARAARSSLLTMGSFGMGQVIRLGSNLILTRLLFPDVFGLMALVSVFLMGLGQLSDVGVTPAILQSRRGDDPEFLDTAWTIQVIRGFGLWLLAAALAWPASLVYGEPQLAHILPCSALTLAILGFRPTRLDTANRHLLIGRVTAIELAVQIIGVVAAVALAASLRSVWALVFSGIIGAMADVILNSLFLPGHRNRLRWEPAAAHELIHFGRWIFFATVCGFLLSQADKILMGKYLPLDVFGVYNIGFFLASFPLHLGGMVVRRVLIPVYRETPPGHSAQNFAKLQRMRFVVSALVVPMVIFFASIGDGLVHLLYDERYDMAGAVVVVLACASIPSVIALTYDQAALASGEVRDFFVLQVVRAAVMVSCLFIGLETAGLWGGMLGQAFAYALMYPAVVWLARRMKAWDPLHDAVFAVLGIVGTVFALWLNWEAVTRLVSHSGTLG